MIVRMFTFQVTKNNRSKLMRFMQQGQGWALLRRIPHLRGAYLLRNQKRKNEYVWITMWSSPSGLKHAIKSTAWKRLYAREVDSGVIFGGGYRRAHFEALLSI
jgi:hypothetical protein